MKKITLLIVGLLLVSFIGYSQPKEIAFVGQPATYNDNIPGADAGLTYDDDRAAVVWFIDDFVANNANVDGTYLSFEDVAG